FEPAPQILKNVRYDPAHPITQARVAAVVEDAKALIGARGRLLVRASGTEPVIRVMGEGDDAAVVEQAVDAVCEALRKVG
ncbi:MAG: phosphoglucosamine mutase, partial [Comamonadaceae bacterium]|nr:phosphoglucosamine mutase [Comamonadaceae bacterium]